jgi:hypothetical protein
MPVWRIARDRCAIFDEIFNLDSIILGRRWLDVEKNVWQVDLRPFIFVWTVACYPPSLYIFTPPSPSRLERSTWRRIHISAVLVARPSTMIRAAHVVTVKMDIAVYGNLRINSVYFYGEVGARCKARRQLSTSLPARTLLEVPDGDGTAFTFSSFLARGFRH